MQYKWPLATNEFSYWDRLKICAFFLNKRNFWTQNVWTKKYEEIAANYVGSKYAVLVSSGSSANDLICKQLKDHLVEKKEWPKRNKVVVGGITWQTNVSVWIREGYAPVFIDINLDDFCLDYNKLEEYLDKNHETVACIFPTTVLGFTPDVERLRLIRDKYEGIELRFDNCEGSESQYHHNNSGGQWYNVCSEYTSSTSCFLAHIWTTGAESGFIFTKSEKEYEYYLLARAHGLLRNLKQYKEKFYPDNFGYYNFDRLRNDLVDSEFDFQILASNHRSCDILAFLGVLNSKNWGKNRYKRIGLYNLFSCNIDKLRYHLPPEGNGRKNVAFSIPIICSGEEKEKRILKVKNLLDEQKIERRNFISGNMLRQLPYQKYGDFKDLKNSEYINNCACYIGLGSHVKDEWILDLVEKLNKL